MMQRSLLNPLRRVSLPVLLAAGFAILVAISGGTLWLVKAAESDADLVAHTLEVQGNLHTLLRFVQFAESGKRAYLLSHNPADREVYRTGVQGVEETFATLRRLTADNQARQNELDDLEPVLRSRLQDMAAAIAAGEAQDRERVLGIMERGLSLMATITARLERMIASEEALLATRSDTYRQASRRLLVSTVTGVLLIVLLAAASTLQVRRSTRSLLDARRALEVANVHLEATVEERTAALRESNAEIQRYAYIVSHDLRTPLVNIMGFTSELEALRSEIFATAVKPEGDPERVRVERDFDESIGFIKAAIAKMDALIGAILKISREGHRVFRPERLNMRELIQGLADAQRHQTEAVGATVTIRDLPPLTADRLAIEQIFGNLFDNAIKYLDLAQPGRIEVAGRETGTRVEYAVRDNGRGIAPEDHARVFELFRRAGAQDRPGEGIGLAHVKALVRSLGGRIDLSSAPGVGTTFTVSLPKAGKTS